MKRAARAFAIVFGVGLLRPAPGTWGSLAALPLALGLQALGGFPVFIMATAVIFILGIWATDIATAGSHDHDPSEIVVDEVAGQLIALLPLSWAATHMEMPMTTFWPGWVAAFALFRLFDILKPGPVGWADRRKDATGVMLDDAIAGGFAAIGVVVLAALWHGVVM